MNSITLLLKLGKFSVQSICVLGKQPFVLNGSFYSQIEGLGMGSPHFLLLCDSCMLYFEEKLFGVCKFPHWFRYVDDTFVRVPSNTDFSSLLSMVNLTVFNSLWKLKLWITTVLFRFLMF